MTHVAVTTDETVLVIDRKEDNPLLKANGKPAWGAVWNLNTNTARPLDIVTHSFCSSGNFLSNGTRTFYDCSSTLDIKVANMSP